jgi:membrane protease YdiL (CAAX protease family)
MITILGREFLNKHKWWLKIILIWVLISLQNLVFFSLYHNVSDFVDIVSFALLIVIICTLYLMFYLKNRGKNEFKINFSESRIIILSLLMTFASLYLINSFVHYKEILNGHLFTIDWRFNWMIENGNGIFLNVIFLIMTVLYTPLIEEILFRGLIQKYLLQRLSPLWAILIATVIFSLSHFELSKVPYTFVGGLLYGIIYFKTKKLIIPILCHCCWNLNDTFVTFSLQKTNTQSILTLLIVLLATVFFYLITKSISD